ncbi:Retrovirus-related Pol polyprotein from transposon RE1 [Vitis vinifera]|uniref:Retrovirus-related Pol polyprotein from transposon RE1 n=1 Tax=Vitis vinifera TaxID=29760 RepID=A0A438EQD2_VITVI|nr:Retrovirus-related Pol polyprotein from transposon RE1 [Vitis vinifera]
MVHFLALEIQLRVNSLTGDVQRLLQLDFTLILSLMQLAMVLASHQALTIQENPTLKSPPRGSQGDFTSSSLLAKTTKLCILALGTFPGNLSSKELETPKRAAKLFCKTELSSQGCEVGSTLRFPAPFSRHESAPKVAATTVIKNRFHGRFSLLFLLAIRIHSGQMNSKLCPRFLIALLSLDLLCRLSFTGYVNGTLPCPSTTLTSENGTTTPNPAYTHWIRQDHLLNAMVSSLSLTIFSFIASATTSLEAWSTLHNTYVKASRSRIIHYRTQLDNLSKGTQSITQYMQSVKICVDVLHLMNVTIDPEEFIIQIFHGLPEMYKDLHSTIHAHETVFPLRNFMRNCFLLRLKLYENLPSILLEMSHCLLPPMLLPNNHNRIDSSINSLTLRLNTVHPNNLNQ